MKPHTLSLAAVLFISTGCAQASLDARAPARRGAIVAGAATTIAERPFQVFIESTTGIICGASIIDASWVLTAQHCMEGETASNIQLLAGSTRLSEASQGQVRDVDQIVRNPGFTGPERGHDATLLHLSSPFTLGGNVQAIALATAADVAAGATDAGVTATVSGWGLRSEGSNQTPDTLQKVDVPILDLADAEQAYGDLTPDQLAAGDGVHDSCQGDSGGPLTVQTAHGRVLAGIVSWGNGCADPNFPGLYGRVSSFHDWITGVMGGDVGGTDPPIDGTWMCNPEWIGDGGCDCGCGAFDTDCSNNTVGACEYNDCDEWQTTPGLEPDALDPTQCAGGVPPDDGGPADQCPPHATPTPDGQACACDAGFVVDDAGTSCVPEGGDPTCPANAAPADDGSCVCDAGFHKAGSACVADVTGGEGEGEGDNGDTGDNADGANAPGRVDEEAPDRGCASAGGATPLGGLALAILLARRRRP